MTNIPHQLLTPITLHPAGRVLYAVARKDWCAVAALDPKRQRFVDEYLIDLNATQAAIRAGYSARTAKQQGSRLLTNADVQAAMSAAQAQRAQRTSTDADRVLRELAFLAFSDLGDLVDFSEDGIRLKVAGDIPEAARRAVSSVKVRRELGGEDKPAAEILEFKLWDKGSALEKLGKHFGLFRDQLDVTIRELDSAIESELARVAGPGQAAAPSPPPRERRPG